MFDLPHGRVGSPPSQVSGALLWTAMTPYGGQVKGEQ